MKYELALKGRKQLGEVALTYNPSFLGGENRKIKIWAKGKKDLISKNNLGYGGSHLQLQLFRKQR
jgi:hypothetical protein